MGTSADVSTGSLSNATAIGYGAVVDASNKIRLGNTAVTVVETSGKVVASAFAGDGSGLTGIAATSLTNGIQVQPNATSPNIIDGFGGNTVAAGVVGATIAGGGASGTRMNAVNGAFGTVGGGANNTAGGGGCCGWAAVAGGVQNTASGYGATVAGGVTNIASGSWAAVPGGAANIASGSYSFAAGYVAKADQAGCFVWSDSAYLGLPTVCGAANRFVAKASGGVIFYTAPDQSTGVQLGPGSGSWSSLSDRNVKEHFAPVDSRGVLARVAHLPIQSWNYKAQDFAIRHIGPGAPVTSIRRAPGRRAISASE